MDEIILMPHTNQENIAPEEAREVPFITVINLFTKPTYLNSYSMPGIIFKSRCLFKW